MFTSTSSASSFRHQLSFHSASPPRTPSSAAKIKTPFRQDDCQGLSFPGRLLLKVPYSHSDSTPTDPGSTSLLNVRLYRNRLDPKWDPGMVSVDTTERSGVLCQCDEQSLTSGYPVTGNPYSKYADRRPRTPWSRTFSKWCNEPKCQVGSHEQSCLRESGDKRVYDVQDIFWRGGEGVGEREGRTDTVPSPPPRVEGPRGATAAVLITQITRRFTPPTSTVHAYHGCGRKGVGEGHKRRIVGQCRKRSMSRERHPTWGETKVWVRAVTVPTVLERRG